MADSKNKNNELNKSNEIDDDPELRVSEEDSYDNPIWFWAWMGGLVVLFFAFGYIQKATDPSKKVERAEQQTISVSQTAQADAMQPVAK